MSEYTDNSISSGASAGEVDRLVRQAQKGDLPAFDALVRQYQRQAVAVAYRLLNNMDDAMEVSQDALLKAFDKLRSLHHAGQFGPWLLRIVSNLALNRRRSRALRAAVPLESPAGADEERQGAGRPDPRTPTPAEDASAHELEDRIGRALAGLPDMQREALVLFSMAGVPQKEVAHMLGCSVEAVKWHVFTARKKLKEVLGDWL